MAPLMPPPRYAPFAEPMTARSGGDSVHSCFDHLKAACCNLRSPWFCTMEFFFMLRLRGSPLSQHDTQREGYKCGQFVRIIRLMRTVSDSRLQMHISLARP